MKVPKRPITIEATKEKIDLIRNCASDNKALAEASQIALAKVMGLIIQNVLPIYASSALIYRDWQYDPEVTTTFPLELFQDAEINTVRVWSQQTAGGMPSSTVVGTADFPFTTYLLDSAVDAKKKVIKHNNSVNILEKMVWRMTQEILRNQELNAWGVIMQAAGTALDDAGNPQVLSATTADVLQVHDFNRLKTAVTRLHQSWVGGTPSTTYGRKGLTDLFLSPEMMEQVRSWLYQPMNTRGVPNSDESTAVALPDAMRQAIWNGGGVPTAFDVDFHELLELGVNRSYNSLFDNFYSGSPSFDGSTQEVLLGLDLSVDSFIRPVATADTLDIDTSSTVVVKPDDQYVARQEKIGFYTKLEEGRLYLDKKNIYALFV